MHRLILAAVCVYLSACGVTVVGEGFHAKYNGRCSHAATPFAEDVEQSGVRWTAARDHLVSELRDRSGKLTRCYVEALANQERLHGRIVVRASVAPSGAIAQLMVAENTTDFEAFGCCVAALVREISWPPSAATSALGLDYPFVFRLVRMPIGHRSDLGSDFVYLAVEPSGYELALDGAMFGGGPVN